MLRSSISIDQTRQITWLLLAIAYYYAGRYQEGELAIEEARSRWPQSWRLYVNGYYLLLFSKRYDEAVVYLRDTNRRPHMLGPEMFEGWMHEANAFASNRPLVELKRLSRIVPEPASVEIQAPEFSGPAMALLGMVDEMFAFFGAFYFGGMVNGTRVDPPGSLDPRTSSFLFAPAVLALQNDPRFARLLTNIGLEDYWRKSGTEPDFRRV